MNASHYYRDHACNLMRGVWLNIFNEKHNAHHWLSDHSARLSKALLAITTDVLVSIINPDREIIQ